MIEIQINDRNILPNTPGVMIIYYTWGTKKYDIISSARNHFDTMQSRSSNYATVKTIKFFTTNEFKQLEQEYKERTNHTALF